MEITIVNCSFFKPIYSWRLERGRELAQLLFKNAELLTALICKRNESCVKKLK
jgi:hypothetical protein